MASDSKYLVSGYISGLKKQNEIDDKIEFPSEIENVCAEFIKYLGRHDYFEQYGSKIRIKSLDKTQISKTIRTWPCAWTTAYGCLPIIPSFHQIYIWKFHINQMKGSICIGIDELQSIMMNHDFSANPNTQNYAYCSNGKLFFSSNQHMSGIRRLSDGSILTMKLDFTSTEQTGKGTLSYIIQQSTIPDQKATDPEFQSQEYKVSFDDISLDTKYKMAVSMAVPSEFGSCVIQLKQYQQYTLSKKK